MIFFKYFFVRIVVLLIYPLSTPYPSLILRLSFAEVMLKITRQKYKIFLKLQKLVVSH